MSTTVGRIIEIGEARRSLSVDRGFMVVKEWASSHEIARIPIDDIAAVIVSGHGVTFSSNLLARLSERGIPFVFSGPDHRGIGVLLPVEGNWQQAKRFDAQLRSSLPLRKQLWAQVVIAKIRQQAAALDSIGVASAPVIALARNVRSGDIGNVEAQAARRYWRLLFGEGFRRDRESPGLNAMLNYGYTVLRSAVARAVIATGLHPTLALHHSNETNAMRLVDDLMEPFRPLVDLQVRGLSAQGMVEVDPAVKRALAMTLFVDRETEEGTTPLITCIHRLAVSLAQVFMKERRTLVFPRPAGLVLTSTTGSAPDNP